MEVASVVGLIGRAEQLPIQPGKNGTGKCTDAFVQPPALVSTVDV
jgi:hypothetical protein